MYGRECGGGYYIRKIRNGFLHKLAFGLMRNTIPVSVRMFIFCDGSHPQLSQPSRRWAKTMDSCDDDPAIHIGSGTKESLDRYPKRGPKDRIPNLRRKRRLRGT